MKRHFTYLFVLSALLLSPLAVLSQPEGGGEGGAFRHLDFSVTAGTTGLGVDFSSPVSEALSLRIGFSAMPHFSYHSSFGVQVGDDASTSKSKFERLSEMLYQFTGTEVDDHVDMVGTPRYWNFSFLADVRPFRNKHWRLTAGFYLGPRTIASAVNDLMDAPSLNAVNIYNNMYDRVNNLEPLLSHNGTNVYLPMELEDRILYYGRMAMHVGDYSHDVTDAQGNIIHRKGDPYLMEPDVNSIVRCTIKANVFKPYVGFGYGGRLLKGDDRYGVSFDAGLMFWGGRPRMQTHDGTDLIRDVENVGGKVGTYVDLFSNVRAFPVLNLRLTRRLF